MAARAIGVDVFKISVCGPVVGYGVAGAIVQHHDEDTFAKSFAFGRCTQRASGLRREIPFAVLSSDGLVGGAADISHCGVP